MNECVDGWMCGWMDVWMNVWMDECVDGWMDGATYQRLCTHHCDSH